MCIRDRSHGRRRACVATRPSRGRHHGPRMRRLRHSSETVRRARADRGRSRRAQARHTSRCPPRRRENETASTKRQATKRSPESGAVHGGSRRVPPTYSPFSDRASPLRASSRRASSPSRRVVAASGALGNKCHAFGRKRCRAFRIMIHRRERSETSSSARGGES